MTGSGMNLVAFLLRPENRDEVWDLERHRDKRSINANALLWKCLDIMAKSIHTDKWSMYLQEIKAHGKYSYVLCNPEAVNDMKGLWRETEEIGEVNVNGRTAVQLLCYYGSSTYNTKEFSDLLNGVLSDMQQMGLQLPPDEETTQLIKEWEQWRVQ